MAIDLKKILPNEKGECADVIKVGGECYVCHRKLDWRVFPANTLWEDVETEFETCDLCEKPSICYKECFEPCSQYTVTGAAVPGDYYDCCDGPFPICCNYDQGPVNSLLAGAEPLWTAFGQGPALSSDWYLKYLGVLNWRIYNICQFECHQGGSDGTQFTRAGFYNNATTAYFGITANWNGQGARVFNTQNGYPALTVTCAS